MFDLFINKHTWTSFLSNRTQVIYEQLCSFTALVPIQLFAEFSFSFCSYRELMHVDRPRNNVAHHWSSVKWSGILLCSCGKKVLDWGVNKQASNQKITGVA